MATDAGHQAEDQHRGTAREEEQPHRQERGGADEHGAVPQRQQAGEDTAQHVATQPRVGEGLADDGHRVADGVCRGRELARGGESSALEASGPGRRLGRRHVRFGLGLRRQRELGIRGCLGLRPRRQREHLRLIRGELCASAAGASSGSAAGARSSRSIRSRRKITMTNRIPIALARWRWLRNTICDQIPHSSPR